MARKEVIRDAQPQLYPFIPLNDFVLLKRISEDVEEVNGIIIPDQAKKKPNKAVVTAVGEGRYVDGKLIPINLVEGDIVLFTRYGGTDIDLDDEEFLVVRAAEIYLKLRK
jgi:chaperonin GroES